MLVQLEIFVAHFLKGREALRCDFFFLLSQGVVYQVLDVVPSDIVRVKAATPHIL